jgi:CubicO group peptidase (beta-lactamase class C family)
LHLKKKKPPHRSLAVRIPALLLIFFILSDGCGRGRLGCGGDLEKRRSKVSKVLDKYVKEERVAGFVALVLRNGFPIYERAYGWADREEQRPMQQDTIFRIASQTKAMTSAAILMLVEEKKISLSDPVEKYIPSFRNSRVVVRAVGATAPQAQEKMPDDPAQAAAATVTTVPAVTEPARRPITIHHLLTHTSGISYGTSPEISEEYKKAELGPALSSAWNLSGKNEPICETMTKLGKLPFLSHPGENWHYGYSTDVLGCVIERASGMTLDAFFRKRLIVPLAMKDTYFFLPVTEKGRFATVYGSGKEGKVVRHEWPGPYLMGPRKNFSGGAGLVSTAADYAKFLEMIRLGGRVGNLKLLGADSVRLMTTSQIGGGSIARGRGFGYGFETTEITGANGKESVGSFGWTGAYGTFYRVDPENRLTIILMTQLMPNGTDIKEKYWAAVYKYLVRPRDSY